MPRQARVVAVGAPDHITQRGNNIEGRALPYWCTGPCCATSFPCRAGRSALVVLPLGIRVMLLVALAVENCAEQRQTITLTSKRQQER